MHIKTGPVADWYLVSIRTRPFGRVMHDGQHIDFALVLFQSAPGLSAG